ncbi:Transcription initiation factor TFIID subunit 3, partial [Ophiophagus hannah]
MKEKLPNREDNQPVERLAFKCCGCCITAGFRDETGQPLGTGLEDLQGDFLPQRSFFKMKLDFLCFPSKMVHFSSKKLLQEKERKKEGEREKGRKERKEGEKEGEKKERGKRGRKGRKERRKEGE